jgi:DNA-binding MarR family transcriptional regulator
MGPRANAASKARAAAYDAATGLIDLALLVQAIQGSVSERHGVTPLQGRLLCVLVTGPRGMAELARCFGVEKAALTGLVDRAQQRGLVERSSVPGDRRAVAVTLTDSGRRVAAAFHQDATTELDRLLAPLGTADRRAFHAALVQILEDAEPAVRYA